MSLCDIIGVKGLTHVGRSNIAVPSIYKEVHGQSLALNFCIGCKTENQQEICQQKENCTNKCTKKACSKSHQCIKLLNRVVPLVQLWAHYHCLKCFVIFSKDRQGRNCHKICQMRVDSSCLGFNMIFLFQNILSCFRRSFPVLERPFPVLERPFLLCRVLSHRTGRNRLQNIVLSHPVDRLSGHGPSRPLARF